MYLNDDDWEVTALGVVQVRRDRRHRFAALPFREKLMVVEELNEIAARLGLLQARSATGCRDDTRPDALG